MAASPQTPMPNGPILDWDEAAVNTYFVSMGLQKYENVIYGASRPRWAWKPR